MSEDLPTDCVITFAQILSRHGARFPTTSKTIQYNSTIAQLQQNVTTYTGKYGFLKHYQYNLGANDLTTFGQTQMIESGSKFYARYTSLARKQTPFFRAGSEARVVASAMNFTQGFHDAKSLDHDAQGAPDRYPYDLVVISEDAGQNNSLSHGLCNKFEDDRDSGIGSSAQGEWAAVFMLPIQKRLNRDLPGANFSTRQVLDIMDLCPFETVASTVGKISPFCDLFAEQEWQQYGYYQSLGKWYGYGRGNPLGPTQGVGFTNELIARMTYKPVVDRTSVNHTLDDEQATFPTGPHQTLFADFSHDNDMTGHFAAMGLYNITEQLSNATLQDALVTQGFSAAWTVPFAARAYFEKMKCSSTSEEIVRVLINDRVVPLQGCQADSLGRCTLNAWVNSLSFARGGGHWDQCFA